MKKLMQGQMFGYISDADKAFVVKFDELMQNRGYICTSLGDGYCWGRHMAIYVKDGVKSKKSYARLYLRDDDIVLRFYFSNVDKHRRRIEAAPEFVKSVFTGEFGKCGHCHNEKEDGGCGHRKSYTVDGKLYEKCDGFTFWFCAPEIRNMDTYMELFDEFYLQKKKAKNS